MGTKVYGTKTKFGTSLYYRPWFDYTVANTDTALNITLSAGIEVSGSGAASTSGSAAAQNNVNEIRMLAFMEITGTGQTKKSGGYSGTPTKSANETKNFTCISSFTWSWTKEHTSETKTISAYSGNANSNKASKSFTKAAKTSYTVSYNANGGSGAPSSQTKWYGETLTLSSTKPTRSGYTFNGWNTSSGGTGTNYSSGASYTSNAALALYAKWTANTAVISYNANGGTQGTSSYPISSTKTTVSYNNSINLIDVGTFALTRTGYHVNSGSEWYSNASGTGGTAYNQATNYGWTTFGSTSASSKSTTIYANWAPNTYSVKYNSNNGTGTMSDSSHTYNTAKNLTSNGYTRTDYTFKGWATSSGSSVVTYTNGQSVKNLTTANGGTVNIYAVWDYNYQDANITNVLVTRVNNDLEDDVEGTRARYEINITPAKNKVSGGYITTNVYLDYKLSSASTWTTINASAPIAASSDSKLVGYLINSSNQYITFDTDKQYDVRVRAEGVVSGSVKTSNASRSTFISKAEFTVDISADGKCIGVFTQADDNLNNTVLINGAVGQGLGVTATGFYSHASGQGTIAHRASQLVIGEYNSQDPGGTDETTKGTYAFIIGNGTRDSHRSTGIGVTWNGWTYHRSADSNADYTDTMIPSANITFASNDYRDYNNQQIGYDQITLNTAGNFYRSFAVRRSVNNNVKLNAIYLGIKSDGSKYVQLGSDITGDSNGNRECQAAWREQLYIANIVSASNSVNVSAGQEYEICTMTIPAYSRFLVLSRVGSSSGSEFQVGNNIKVKSGTASYFASAMTRSKCSSGQGVMNYALVFTTSQAVTISLSCYGYYTTSHTESGGMYGISLGRNV